MALLVSPILKEKYKTGTDLYGEKKRLESYTTVNK